MLLFLSFSLFSARIQSFAWADIPPIFSRDSLVPGLDHLSGLDYVLFSTYNAQILLSQKSFDIYVTHGVAVSPLSRHRVEHFLVMFVQVSNLWFHTYLGEGVGKKTLKGHKIWSLSLMNPYLIQQSNGHEDLRSGVGVTRRNYEKGSLGPLRATNHRVPSYTRPILVNPWTRPAPWTRPSLRL